MIFFRFDPEDVHDHMISFGETLGSSKISQFFIALLFYYQNDMLRQKICGISFPNPIGLSAGFDKNAQLTDIMPSVGFGFMEVGSITAEPCEGNHKPRLWRLKESKSLLVYYGLKNDGAKRIARKLRHKKCSIPLGISIAKTNSEDTVDLERGIADYVKGYTDFLHIGDYYTINISCPNTFGGQPFTNPAMLDLLLTQIDNIPHTKPIFLKISPDLPFKAVNQIIAVVDKHDIQGFICSNLTKNRNNSSIHDKDIPNVGGMGGKVLENLTNNLIRYVYRKTKGKYVIIGSGGVFTAEDAFIKISYGASLIQLITGMVYEGPQLIGQINSDLVKILQEKGYSSISEAIGCKAY